MNEHWKRLQKVIMMNELNGEEKQSALRGLHSAKEVWESKLSEVKEQLNVTKMITSINILEKQQKELEQQRRELELPVSKTLKEFRGDSDVLKTKLAEASMIVRRKEGEISRVQAQRSAVVCKLNEITSKGLKVNQNKVNKSKISIKRKIPVIRVEEQTTHNNAWQVEDENDKYKQSLKLPMIKSVQNKQQEGPTKENDYIETSTTSSLVSRKEKPSEQHYRPVLSKSTYKEIEDKPTNISDVVYNHKLLSNLRRMEGNLKYLKSNTTQRNRHIINKINNMKQLQQQQEEEIRTQKMKIKFQKLLIKTRQQEQREIVIKKQEDHTACKNSTTLTVETR